MDQALKTKKEAARRERLGEREGDKEMPRAQNGAKTVVCGDWHGMRGGAPMASSWQAAVAQEVVTSWVAELAVDAGEVAHEAADWRLEALAPTAVDAVARELQHADCDVPMQQKSDH